MEGKSRPPPKGNKDANCQSSKIHNQEKQASENGGIQLPGFEKNEQSPDREDGIGLQFFRSCPLKGHSKHEKKFCGWSAPPVKISVVIWGRGLMQGKGFAVSNVGG